MEKAYFDYEPPIVTFEGEWVLICFDVEHVQEERINPKTGETELVDVIKAYAVRVHQPLTYARIVDAIVTAAYPNDVMWATVNNYLLDETEPEHKSSFDEMQAWRAKAKSVATEVMEIVGNEGVS